MIGQFTAPIYDGGTAASQTRQAKELAAQSRLVLDQVRNQARTAAIGAWVANEGAKIAVAASESEVRAATVALQGVQKEAAGGQRTTVDVLNSQQDLISAKARLIGAQRDRVIASYTLLSAIGRLDVKTLGAQYAGLSARGALPSGARRLARPAHAVGAVILYWINRVVIRKAYADLKLPVAILWGDKRVRDVVDAAHLDERRFGFVEAAAP